ncbi:hypothetical protein JCM8097_007975 [Rhodosporidiobolus ruineniae]
MARARSSRATSRASSADDVEIVETASTSPATSVQVEDTVDGEAQGDAGKEQASEEVKAPPKPKAVIEALRKMMAKTQVYVNRINDTLIAAQEAKRKENGEVEQEEQEDSDDDIIIVESTSPGKRKQASNAGKSRKKPKTDADKDTGKGKKPQLLPPMELNQRENLALVTGGTLKDYQMYGVSWLAQRFMFAMHGAILADEMGTGKTLQTIAWLGFIHQNFHKAEKPTTDKPSIIIMPKPLLHNWASEFEKFAPGIPYIVYDGTPEERGNMRQERLGLAGFKNAAPNRRRKAFPVILVSYGILMRDINYLSKLSYDAVILDEAHKAKNLKGKTLASLRQLKSEFRLLLTGTPLQNNLEELYALLYFILPHVFNDQEAFSAQFDFSAFTDSDGTHLSAEDQVELLVAQLQNLLTPFMLRRCKKDVIKNLPLKKEYFLQAPMTARQKELTDAAMKGELRQFLVAEAEEKRSGSRSATTSAAASPAPSSSSGGKRKRGARELASLGVSSVEPDSDAAEEGGPKRRTRAARTMKSYAYGQDAADDDEFEQDLVKRSEREEREAQEAKLAKAMSKPKAFDMKRAKFQSAMMNLRHIANHPLQKLDNRDDGADPEDIVNLSGKMLILDRLLPELFKRGHKVILFSQFTKMLDLLDDYFELRGWNRFRIDGTRDFKVDQEEIREFNEKPYEEGGENIYTLSTRSGGVGLNLVGADTVILFDSDWNPQNDLQAMDRAHRIGQKKPVLVFRLATVGTVEGAILASATRKRKLEKVVLGNDTLTGSNAAIDVLNKAKGKKGGQGKSQKEAERNALMAQLAATGQGEKIELAGKGENVLPDDVLNALLDRSDEAMKSTSGAKGAKGAGFEVVETIEAEQVQQKSTLADLLEDGNDRSATTSAAGTDDEDE